MIARPDRTSAIVWACWTALCGMLLPNLVVPHTPEKTLNPGESVNIPCTIVTPGGSVQWVQNGKPVVLDSTTEKRRQWSISRDGQAALTIKGVTREDEGLWECWQLGGDGTVQRVAQVLRLHVTNAPEDPYIELEGRRLAHQSTITVKDKNSITLNCVVRGGTPQDTRLDWLLGNKNITSSGELLIKYVPEADTYLARSVVILNITRQLHKKEVICQVSHVTWLQAAAVSASLNVLYSPSFSISREPGFGYPILEGMVVSLKCDIDANPPSPPTWLKDDGVPSVTASPDGFLNFTSINRTDAGWYRCTTQHEFGYFASFGYYLNVRYGPEIVRQPPTEIQANVGGQVRLECAADGRPPPSYCWSRVKDGGQLEGVSTERDLEMDSVLYSDAGTYKCIVHSQVGKVLQKAKTHDVHLSVTGRPEADPVNKTLMAIVGREVRLSVQFCANPRPQRAHWILRHVVLSPGEAIKTYIASNATATNMLHCYLASLEIVEVKPEDAGEILFFVKNSKGIDDAVILLNVTQASFSISIGSEAVRSSSVFVLVLLLLCLLWIQKTTMDYS